MQNIQVKVWSLTSYIKNLNDFVVSGFIEGNYNHIGATITDAILQAGLRYETVVRPRVDKIKKYPEAKTTTGFSNFFKKEGLDKLLNWTNREKLSRIENVTEFFIKEQIETQEDLKKWLSADDNVERLKELRGIGDKTVDYFKILVGIPASAIDRHLMNFLRQAGVEAGGYHEAKEIIDGAADNLNIDRSKFDYSIWKYMSDKSKNKRRG